MALIQCPECGREVSDSATKCPHCGYNVKSYQKKQSRENKKGTLKKSVDNSINKTSGDINLVERGILGKRIPQIIFFVIIIGVVIGFLIFYSQNCMPNLVGLTSNEAIELLEKKNIAYTIEKDLSYDYEKDYVFDQSITANHLCKKEDIVVIKVSTGKKYVVPDIVGKNINDVSNQIANLSTEIEYDGTDNIDEDIIYSMSKEAGEDIKSDESLVICVSRGKNKIVPRIIGMEKDKAEIELKNVGLEVEFEEDLSSYSKGIVFDYTPKKYVNEGEKITVYVSSGQIVSMPDLIGKTKTYAEMQLDKLSIDYVISSEYGDITVDCQDGDSVAIVTYQDETANVSSDSKFELRTSKAAITISIVDWDINYANGVDTYISFQNTSDKEIAYVTFEMQYFDRMGKPANCEIQNSSTMYLQYTGPLQAGRSVNSEYWRAVIYNPTIDAIRPNSAEIEFTDGSKQKLTYTGRYWYGSDYYGGDLKD